MNIKEQVEYLMQGTEYGDQNLKQNMADELEARLAHLSKGRKTFACLLRF